jgi:hypothetical protein
MTNRVTTASLGDDWGKWLKIAGALIALGVLPKKHKAPVAIAAIIWGLR